MRDNDLSCSLRWQALCQHHWSFTWAAFHPVIVTGVRCRYQHLHVVPLADFPTTGPTGFDIKHLRKDLLKRTPAQDLPSNWLILDSYKVVSECLGHGRVRAKWLR